MPEFIPGLRLGALFYEEAVRPVLDSYFTDVPHSAALIGSGSEILGFDTEMSTDHHWGPRVMLFLTPADHTSYAEDIRDRLRYSLPHDFHGYPTSFGEPDAIGVQLMQTRSSGPVNHRVEVYTIARFVQGCLNVDLDDELTPADWLTFPAQRLLTLTSGAVYHDAIGLEAVRQRFAFYPHDVWLYLLAAAWTRISQEEHLMPRAGHVGDELGSALIGSRLVRDIMRLGFLMERQYAPYPKWFGTAFARLNCATALTPHLWAAQRAENWPEREQHLSAAYEHLARMHNALGITEPVPEAVSSFYDRPFNVIHAGEIAGKIAEHITDPALLRIIETHQGRLIGGIDLISDNTDVLEVARHRPQLKKLYQ